MFINARILIGAATPKAVKTTKTFEAAKSVRTPKIVKEPKTFEAPKVTKAT